MMEIIDIKKAMSIAKKKGLVPARVKACQKVMFTKGQNPNLEPLSWADFEKILKERKLVIREYGGFMKIMSA